MWSDKSATERPGSRTRLLNPLEPADRHHLRQLAEAQRRIGEKERGRELGLGFVGVLGEQGEDALGRNVESGGAGGGSDLVELYRFFLDSFLARPAISPSLLAKTSQASG